jgi:release factor glutamine methyltransferase
MAYEPREDSLLLAEQVKKYAKGKILDMGTGTGIQALNAVENADSVVACDIDPEALETAKDFACKKIQEYEKNNNKKKEKNNTNANKQIIDKIKKIKFVHSDLFSNIKEKFDTIIFNPPYLPADKRDPDIALDGGKKGYELLERFLNEANDYLETDGKILLLFSSLTNKQKIDEIIKKNLFEYKQLSSQKIFFEELYVYLIWKSEILKELEKKGLTKIKFLAKGHRGNVYIAGKYAIKIEKQDSGAIERINNEANWLKRLNKERIGPKLKENGKNYLIMDCINGIRIEEYLQRNGKEKIKKIIKQVLLQCKKMDEMKVNKEEMGNPYKHIIIKQKPVMIDFERCRYTNEPHNVTQFLDYISGKKIGLIIEKKGIKFDKKKIMQLAKEYKKSYGKKEFERIIKYIEDA